MLASPDPVRMLDGGPGVQQELMRFQVETATRVCTSLDGLGRELTRLRWLVAENVLIRQIRAWPTVGLCA